jgi:hypothetical protein
MKQLIEEYIDLNDIFTEEDAEYMEDDNRDEEIGRGRGYRRRERGRGIRDREYRRRELERRYRGRGMRNRRRGEGRGRIYRGMPFERSRGLIERRGFSESYRHIDENKK